MSCQIENTSFEKFRKGGKKEEGEKKGNPSITKQEMLCVLFYTIIYLLKKKKTELKMNPSLLPDT